MLDITRRNDNMYPLLPNKTLFTSNGALSKSSSRSQLTISPPSCYDAEPMVKAATLLCRNSSTEIIDVTTLSQNSSPLIQYVEIADTSGRLFCVDRKVNTHCWLKIISIANDCQSCNVVLMPTDNGVVLKTIRSIPPGEPLLMWFAENILAMLNMPYLTNLNIKENQYRCHVCNHSFDYPNPLKIHLALQCNRLDNNHLWAQLAKEFTASTFPALTINIFQKLPPFSFKLSSSPRSSPDRSSPILISNKKAKKLSDSLEDFLGSDGSYSLCSPSSSEQSSSISSSETSPIMNRAPTFFSTPSSVATSATSKITMQVSPANKHNVVQRQSAFKPYTTKCRLFTPMNAESTITPYHTHPPVSAIMKPDAQAAHMETIVSNLGKSTEGHQCLYCGKMYSRKYGLKIHIRTHTGYKPLKCKFCLRPFGDPSNLNKHVRLHADGEALSR